MTYTQLSNYQAPLRQKAQVYWWSIFQKRKFEALTHRLNQGTTWNYAYSEAKSL